MKKIFSIMALAMLTLAVATSCGEDDVYPAQLFISGEGITNNEVNLKAQQTVQINLTLWPSYSLNEGISYKSSNEKVATVDANGVVKGIDTGTADIIVTCANMPQKYYFLDHDYATVTLKVHVTGSTLQLQSGEKSQSDAEARELEW